MVFAISATAYCTLTYVAGFKLFNVRKPSKGTVLFWAFSPITVPVGLLLVSIAG